MMKLRHPNIVAAYEYTIDPRSDMLYIICEYVDGGDLEAYLNKLKKSDPPAYLSEAQIKGYMIQVLYRAIRAI